MALRINYNYESISAQRNLTSTQGSFFRAIEQLSSGLRINKAADDAAGAGHGQVVGGARADHPAADDGHTSASHPGDAAEQDSLAASLLLEISGAHLHGHAAGDGAHRGQERQPPGVGLDEGPRPRREGADLALEAEGGTRGIEEPVGATERPGERDPELGLVVLPEPAGEPVRERDGEECRPFGRGTPRSSASDVASSFASAAAAATGSSGAPVESAHAP